MAEIIEKEVLTKPKFEENSKGGLMVVLKDKNNVIKQSFTRTRVKGVGSNVKIEKIKEAKK